MILFSFFKNIFNFLYVWIKSIFFTASSNNKREAKSTQNTDKNQTYGFENKIWPKKPLNSFLLEGKKLNSKNDLNQQSQQTILLKESDINLLINQGNYGISLYQKGNIKESKSILVPICEKMFKIYKTDPNPILKKYLNNLLKIAEEIDRKIKVHLLF